MERVLFGVEVRSDENGFLCVSDLRAAYSAGRELYGWDDRRPESQMNTSSFKSTIYQYMISLGIINSERSEYDSEIMGIGIVKFLKRNGVYYTKGRAGSKVVYAKDWLWKVVYKSMFDVSALINTPKFILDIGDIGPCVNGTLTAPRSLSQEKTFIDRLILSSDLISSNIKRQFNFCGFRYDLRIDLLGRPFLIEFHEKQHISQKERINDREKFNVVAEHNDFALIVIPYKKQTEQLDFIRECLSKGYDAEYINGIEFYRHYSAISSESIGMDMSNINSAINNKVFGVNHDGIRNMAPSKELLSIEMLESHVCNLIQSGLIKNEEDIIRFVHNVNI
jgi:hypothetical protein